MRVRYSFSSRKTGHLENLRKQREKYPKVLQKVIETSDIIMEILDARFIEETRNIEVEKVIKQKEKRLIYVLNKIDLIDLQEFKQSKRAKEIMPYVFVSCKNRSGGKDLRTRIKIEAKKVRINNQGKYNRVQVGVIGYPNTGKSSVINLLIGRPSAGTGAEEGFTKGVQKIRLTEDILLLDSPGVIPSEKYSQDKQEFISHHAKVGARTYARVRNPEQIVAELIIEYKPAFEKMYGVTAEDGETFIEAVGKKET